MLTAAALNRFSHASNSWGVPPVLGAILAAIVMLSSHSARADKLYVLPEPGIVTYAEVFFNMQSFGSYIMFRPDSGGPCSFTYAGETEKVTIRGSSGPDLFIDLESPNPAATTYQEWFDGLPEFCGYTIANSRPGADPGRAESIKLTVSLLGGDDIFYVQEAFGKFYGGSGNDIMRDAKETSYSDHSSAVYMYGGSGNDFLFGQNLYGESGDDALCSVTARHESWYVNGGTGTDTYCGGGVWEGRRSSIEYYRGSRCPEACELWLFGW